MKDEKELDELFEQSLQALENGQAAQTVAAGLPEDAGELAALIHLAAAVRETAHPVPSPESMRATRARIAALVATKQPARPGFRPVWAFGLAGLALLFLFAFVLAAAGGVWWYGPLAAHAATLADASGTVEVASADGADWHAVAAGDTLQSGQQIRTGADSSATLAFFEGSRASLGPDTSLSLTGLAGGWGDVLRVDLFQQTGSARYNVVPFRDGSAHFVVDTPSGSASVHGTVFGVALDGQGHALFTVDRGNVSVENAGAQVSLGAGQATSSAADHAPQPAAFRFAVSTQFNIAGDGSWNLEGQPFQVEPGTTILGHPQPGQPVFVQGRILDKNHWTADLVSDSPLAQDGAQLTGVVQAIQAGSWDIAGTTVLTDATTSVGENIAVGDTVLVVYRLQDGNLLASQIEKLNDTDENAQSFCTGADPQPKAQTLAEKYGVPYAEIMGWFCQGFGFGEIDLAYGLSGASGRPVSEIFALRRQGLGWGEIKKQPGITPTATATATLPTDLTLTPAPTETATVTPTLDLTLEATPSGTETTDCTGANPQPKAQALAAEYGVSTDEIMGWFCQGFGFGEIDLAYGLSKESGRPVSDLFAMKKSGLGWGQIKQEVEQDKDKGKGKHNKP